MTTSPPQPSTFEPDRLAQRRRRFAALADGLDLPRFKGAAGWEFTDLGKLDLGAFAPAEGGDPAAGDRADRLFGDVQGGARLVQVDGRVVTGPGDVAGAAGLPGTGEAPADEPSAEVADPPAGDAPIVMPLALAAAHHPELVARHLGTIVDGEADLFAARNEAEWTGGAFVYVPRNVRVEEPIVVTVVQDAEHSALHWRTLVLVDEGAEAEVWEEYLSADEGGETLLNTSVELSVGQNASLRYVCGQNLSERAWIFGSQRAEVARDGALDWVALGFGSARGRVRMETKLAGPGADAKVTGAYATHGRQHVDFDTLQEHAAPNTTSDLAFRGVLQDRSSAVWRGMIQVDPGAQQTDAFQESRNLLLSKRAHADAIPGLEIQANDVRCTHAAAIAQIDPEQLFYLESRGLRNETAKHLVIEGFLQALVERFEAGPVREVLSGALERRLEAVLG